MDRVLQLGFFLLCLTGLSYGQGATCSYFGEPHLVPYPTECEPIQRQYVCQPPVPEVLVQNQFLVFNVVSTPVGNYPIVKYNLTIFGVPGYPDPCYFGDSIGVPSPIPPVCPPTSPVIVVGVSATSYYLIHKTHPDTIIRVNKIKRYFEVSISQSFQDIGDSEGVCIDWDCEFETDVIEGLGKRSVRDNDLATQIATLFANFAQSLGENYGTVDSGTLFGRLAALIYDLRITGYISFGDGVVIDTVQRALVGTEHSAKFQSTATQAQNDIADGLCSVYDAVRQLVDQAGAWCTGSTAGNGCFEILPTDLACVNRKRRGSKDEN